MHSAFGALVTIKINSLTTDIIDDKRRAVGYFLAVVANVLTACAAGFEACSRQGNVGCTFADTHFFWWLTAAAH